MNAAPQFQKRVLTPEQIAAGRPCKLCRNYVPNAEHCVRHGKTMPPNGNCEDWNRSHEARLVPPQRKYDARAIPDDRRNAPLILKADRIAKVRGRQHHSARWWEVFHAAHEKLVEAHMEGQSAGLARLAMLAGRMYPKPDPWDRFTPIQEAERALLDAIIRQCGVIEPEPPEPPSTER